MQLRFICKLNTDGLGILGEDIKPGMEIKLLVNFEKTNFQTNLLAFLKNYTPVVNESLQSASRRLQPVIIHWDNTTEKMNSNIDIIIDNLSIDVLPSLMVKKKPCPPNHLLSTLVDYNFAKACMQIKPAQIPFLGVNIHIFSLVR